MKKLLLVILLLIFGTTTVNAQAFTVGYLNYSVNDDGVSASVVGHVNGEEATGSIVVPNAVSYNGQTYPVTAIGQYAFRNHRNLNGTLTIGSNIREIGYGAFVSCVSLSGNLTIPTSVVNIDAHAFKDCRSLTGSLTIPNSVRTIGACAFEQCIGFDGILTIGSSVDTIGAAAFQLCRNFTRAVSLASEPPYLEILIGPNKVFTFYGFGCSTLTVPCGSKTAYEQSAWQTTYGIGGTVLSYGFENIIQNCEDVEEFVRNAISIYPNPTSRTVIIQSENIRNIRIYNILGEQIFESAVSGSSFKYDFIRHETGIYLIIIETPYGIMAKKVIVDK